MQKVNTKYEKSLMCVVFKGKFLLCLCNLFQPKKSNYRNVYLCHCHIQTSKRFHPLNYFYEGLHQSRVKTFIKTEKMNILFLNEKGYDIGQSSVI